MFVSILVILGLTIRTILAKTTQPNIILIISDGHGAQHNELGRIIEYGTGYKSHRISSYLKSHVVRPITTYNSDFTLTDSAAAATAISTGYRTKNGRLAVDPHGARLQTLVEFAKAQGYATGVVSKIHLAHATPGGFLSHSKSRKDITEICSDIMHGTSTADVMFGAGDDKNHFKNPKLFPELPENPTDDQITEAAKKFWNKKGYTFIDSNQYRTNYANGKDVFDGVKAPVMGVFADTDAANDHPSLKYVIEADNNTIKSEPTLVKLMAEATRILHETGKPFFLMVEQSMVDMASHEHNDARVVGESIEMEHMVRMAQSWVDDNTYGKDLRLFLTADHATGDIQLTDTLEKLLEAENKGEAPLPSDSDDLEEANRKRLKRLSYLNICWSGICENGVRPEQDPDIILKHSPAYVMFAGYGNGVLGANKAGHLTDIRKTIENAILYPEDNVITNTKIAAGNTMLFSFIIAFIVLALVALMVLAGCTNCFKSRMVLL